MDGLVCVGSTQPEEPDPLDPEIIKRIRNIFMYRPVSKGFQQQWMSIHEEEPLR